MQVVIVKNLCLIVVLLCVANAQSKYKVSPQKGDMVATETLPKVDEVIAGTDHTPATDILDSSTTETDSSIKLEEGTSQKDGQKPISSNSPFRGMKNHVLELFNKATDPSPSVENVELESLTKEEQELPGSTSLEPLPTTENPSDESSTTYVTETTKKDSIKDSKNDEVAVPPNKRITEIDTSESPKQVNIEKPQTSDDLPRVPIPETESKTDVNDSSSQDILSEKPSKDIQIKKKTPPIADATSSAVSAVPSEATHAQVDPGRIGEVEARQPEDDFVTTDETGVSDVEQPPIDVDNDVYSKGPFVDEDGPHDDMSFIPYDDPSKLAVIIIIPLAFCVVSIMTVSFGVNSMRARSRGKIYRGKRYEFLEPEDTLQV